MDSFNGREVEAIKSKDYSALEFAGKVSRAMKKLSSSHVYFVMQQAYGDIDWSEVERIFDQVMKETDSEDTPPNYHDL